MRSIVMGRYYLASVGHECRSWFAEVASDELHISKLKELPMRNVPHLESSTIAIQRRA